MHRIRIMYVPSSAAAALALTLVGVRRRGCRKSRTRNTGSITAFASSSRRGRVPPSSPWILRTTSDRGTTAVPRQRSRSERGQGPAPVCERAATATARTSTASYTREQAAPDTIGSDDSRPCSARDNRRTSTRREWGGRSQIVCANSHEARNVVAERVAWDPNRWLPNAELATQDFCHLR